MVRKGVLQKHPARRRPLIRGRRPPRFPAHPARWAGTEPSPAGQPSPLARGLSPRRARSRRSVPTTEQQHSPPPTQPPPAGTWAAGAPPPRRELEETCECRLEPGPYLPTGAEPNRGEPGKRSSSRPRSLSQLGSASRGGSRGRPTPGKPTPPRRNGSSETRYPVPGS